MSEIIDKAKLEEYYEKIVSSRMTLKEAAQQEGINKDYLRRLITIQIGSDDNKKDSFFKRLKQNSSQNTAKEIDEVIRTNIKLYLLGKVTIRDASITCNINEETFKNKVFEQLEESPELLELYLRNGTNKRDYSQVNTRLIIINMLRNDMTQSGIARILGIPNRTISGWVNKLPQEDELRNWAKDAAYRTIHCIKLSPLQLEDLNQKLDAYIQEYNITEQELDTRSLEERQLEEVEKFLEKVYDLENEVDGNGKKKYTRKQIMRMLNVGNSAIRRAEIKRDNLKLIINGREKQVERGE